MPPSDAPGSSTRPGFLHTQGSSIVDATGRTVRLTGLSWFGFETSNYAPHGIWQRSMTSMLDQVRALGYNVIRVPWCNQTLDAGITPNGIDFGQNPDLRGLSAVEVLDWLVAGARTRGLRIILDRHRPDANARSELWYTGAYDEARWIRDWITLARRYRDDPTVIGVDLHNEPHGAATWGDGNMATDWRLAAERAGNAGLASAPGPVHRGFAARASTTMSSAQAPDVVAAGTLAALGRRGTARPGLLAKLLALSLAFLPRWCRALRTRRSTRASATPAPSCATRRDHSPLPGRHRRRGGGPPDRTRHGPPSAAAFGTR